MAEGWYGVRHRSIFTRELEDLAARWGKGRLLNAGCGHGADFIPFTKSFHLYGLDFSAGMLEMARRYAAKYRLAVELLQGDMAELPYRPESFDWVISVAALHHLKGRQRQLKALQELHRVLKTGGEAFITVWNHYQPRFWLRRSESAFPWKSKGKVYYRYYYLFNYCELEALVKKAGFRVLYSKPESRYHFPLKYFSRNICVMAKKD